MSHILSISSYSSVAEESDEKLPEIPEGTRRTVTDLLKDIEYDFLSQGCVYFLGLTLPKKSLIQTLSPIFLSLFHW